MTREDIIRMAKEARFYINDNEAYSPSNQEDFELTEHLERFAILVAKQQREEDAKLVESMTLEWPDQPQFAQVERTTIQDCATIIRQRAVTYD
jgi:hypothetical protein